MRCEDVQQVISDSLDGGQPLDDQARRHLEHCASCATFERDCGQLDDLLTAGRLDAPPVQRRRSARNVLVFTGLAAAVIGLALLPVWRPAATPTTKPPTDGQSLPVFNFDVDYLAAHTARAALEPVRQEMASLSADARTITNSLWSCLPSAPVGRLIQTAPYDLNAVGKETIQ